MPVEVGVRFHGHRGVPVVALHVDDVDARERRQLREKAVIPVCGGIKLEVQAGVHAAHRSQRGEAGELVEPDRHDEGDGLRHSPDGVLQGEPVLAQGEVERRALERPPAVEAGAVADRLDRKEVGQPQERGELVEGPPAAQPREVARAAELLDLVDLIPGDVLALSFMPISRQADHGGDLGEPARRIPRQRQQLAAFDLEGQLGDAGVRRVSATRGNLGANGHAVQATSGSSLDPRTDRSTVL
jgi:hypothetical protein